MDDIFHRLQGPDDTIEYNGVIYNEELTYVEDLSDITITGKDLSRFGMSRPRWIEEIINDIMQKLSYDTEEMQQRLTEFVPLLNPEQNRFR
ncbi:hypothetical protein AVEN_10454-1 [Araneus ventricosus]|uniref:Uncharacterized protein n=1 Tax=Araneus ventricosus TaxID=182803 RepID=A0A4Y2N1F8_ARAVE|nr:hypothetical protein AVEN_10454-1 [Araneus ventricosus]